MTLLWCRYPPFNRVLQERGRKERERFMQLTLVNVDHFPENIVFEILSWLRVKDLLRFKTVCKSWYAIISSPTFVAKHLKNNYIKDDVDYRCCFLLHRTTPIEVNLYKLLVDETPRVLDKDYLALGGTYVYGPCNGLYYVIDFTYDCGLWNPATNQFYHLPNIIDKPDLPPLFTPCYPKAYGFGLDPFTGDYKVVVIKDYIEFDNNIKLLPSVFVYDIERNTSYIYVSGCCYWFGSYEYCWGVIISFDFATDAYAEIPVPDYLTDSYKELLKHDYCLGVYDELLAFMCFHRNVKIFDIWTREKKGSWTKKLRAGPFPDVWDPIFYCKGNKILLKKSYWKGGSLVKELVLFDPETQEVRDFGFRYEWGCDGVFSYMESLVSIKRYE